MPTLSTITLDTTLADLYRFAGPRYADKRIAQVLCGVSSWLELTANFPRNIKYVYQESSFSALSGHSATPVSDKSLQRHLTVECLSLVPQRYAFISGNTVSVFFNVGEDDAPATQDRRELERTLGTLNEAQRPKILFCPGPTTIPVKEDAIDLIACKHVLDGLESKKLVVPPDIHWLLNSKEALATSGLPTPNCDIIVPNGYCGDARLCCRVCEENKFNIVVPTTCEGGRGKWVAEQSQRVYDKLSAKPLPFVLKTQQSIAGAGTYIVRTEKDRKEVIGAFRGGIMQTLLSSVTESNMHLRPASLLLSDLIEDAIGDYALAFFITDDVEPVFLAVSQQILVDAKAWVGNTINYKHQCDLKKRFEKLVRKIGHWLRGQGYVGPAGADVLETATDTAIKPGVSGDSSQLHIIDLNVRITGSFCLALMQNHFTSRSLHSAASFSFNVRKRREEFIWLFQEYFQAGRMCILSWYEFSDQYLSFGHLAIGAEDEINLNADIRHISDAAGLHISKPRSTTPQV